MMQKNQAQKRYLRRAKIAANFLQIAPFVRMICLNGSVAMSKAQESSDIDFFIVLKKNRLWTGRLFVTFLVQLTGLRRVGTKIAGRICLNRYQTENSLSLNPKTKKNALHHSYTICLWQRQNLFEEFIQSNSWFKKFSIDFKHKKSLKTNYLWLILSHPIQFFGEFIFDLIFNDWGESILKSYQTKRILKDPRTKKSPPGAIYLSDQELRFHPKKS